MSTLTCAQLLDVAPELALGTLSGRQRAAALDHLDLCADCRSTVEGLSDAADALLLVAPEAEPPTGFAGRVVAGFEAPRQPRRRAILRLAAIAAVVLAVAAVGTASVETIAGRRTSSSPSSFALQAPGVRVAHFVSATGEEVQGNVFSYADRPSWVFMTVRDDGSSDGSNDAYRCQIEIADGRWIDVGSFQLHDGAGSWGKTVTADLHQLRAVRLVDDHGSVAATASVV